LRWVEDPIMIAEGFGIGRILDRLELITIIRMD
jgi:hypothetical protein